MYLTQQMQPVVIFGEVDFRFLMERTRSDKFFFYFDSMIICLLQGRYSVNI